jgi:hypothetical protein
VSLGVLLGDTQIKDTTNTENGASNSKTGHYFGREIKQEAKTPYTEETHRGNAKQRVTHNC